MCAIIIQQYSPAMYGLIHHIQSFTEYWFVAWEQLILFLIKSFILIFLCFLKHHRTINYISLQSHIWKLLLPLFFKPKQQEGFPRNHTGKIFVAILWLLGIILINLMAAELWSLLKCQKSKCQYFESVSHGLFWHDHNEMQSFRWSQFSAGFYKNLSNDSLQGQF